MKDNTGHDNDGIDFGPELDLHHFHPRDTSPVVNEFLRQAVLKGYKVLRIVHGKGRSVKKREVYNLLQSHPQVNSFGDDGSNWGATIIELKR